MIRAAMGGRRLIVLALLALPSAAALGAALATSPTATANPEDSSASRTAPYLPSISDMMIATIQPRHRKLWQAAQDKNWAFAAYELGNLRGAFDRIGRAHPTEHNISFPAMIASVTGQPFTELDTAITSKDDAGFAKAYADLTSGCNSCHQALDHGVVVIQVPSAKSGSDQDFTR